MPGCIWIIILCLIILNVWCSFYTYKAGGRFTGFLSMIQVLAISLALSVGGIVMDSLWWRLEEKTPIDHYMPFIPDDTLYYKVKPPPLP